mmetsp:Transcript_32085/g.88439  ORF Transcript_32085/g.88439 Transcript_32085/m.88439 type:complete len:233 (-) Transcript_32085:454-1152(-)
MALGLRPRLEPRLNSGAPLLCRAEPVPPATRARVANLLDLWDSGGSQVRAGWCGLCLGLRHRNGLLFCHQVGVQHPVAEAHWRCLFGEYYCAESRGRVFTHNEGGGAGPHTGRPAARQGGRPDRRTRLANCRDDGDPEDSLGGHADRLIPLLLPDFAGRRGSCLYAEGAGGSGGAAAGIPVYRQRHDDACSCRPRWCHGSGWNVLAAGEGPVPCGVRHSARRGCRCDPGCRG